MEGIPEDKFEIYKDVVNGAYRFHDMMLQTLLDLAGPDTTVHAGFRSRLSFRSFAAAGHSRRSLPVRRCSTGSSASSA